VALGGLVAGQGLGAASQARAIELLNGWDGTFQKNQLWVLDHWTPTQPKAISEPGSVEAGSFTDGFLRLFNSNSAKNGTSCSGDYYNLAFGPLMARRGHTELMGLLSAHLMGDGGLIYANNCYKTGDVLPSGAAFNSSYGGEINQRNGLLYTIHGASTSFDGDEPDNPDIAIVGLDVAAGDNPDPNTWATQKPTFTWKSIANSPTVPAAGADLAAAAKAANWGSQTGDWSLGSDMAIDANGNAYRMARSPSGNHWALVRFNIPRDQDGLPTSQGWTYNVVQTFDDAGVSSTVWGMAFMDGLVYTIHSDDAYRRWNPLTGAHELLGHDDDPVDLGSAQAAPVISGRVFNDAAGAGAVEGASGVGGVAVEIYQAAANGAVSLAGSVTTDADGSYSALLPSANATFYLRLAQPQIDGANARQTYASAGQFTEAGAANTLSAYCWDASGDYRERTESGACGGARRDGIDPAQVDHPLAAQGGAGTVSKVVMTTDLAVVTADFGISAAGSWGDAPDAYRTSNAASGPYANPKLGQEAYLYLGSEAGWHQDGEPSASASNHSADDGLEISPTDALGGPTGAWAPAQSQIMVAGQRYAFRAKASGAPAALASASVKAWITGLTSSGATEASFNQTLLGAGGCTAAPDGAGYVYCSYQAPGSLPAGGIAPVYARLRISPDASVTATSRGAANPETSAWAPLGEIEDYQLGVAGAVLRIEARSLGNVAANVRLALSNTSATAPSSATAAILTNAASSFTAARSGHALVSRAAATTLTTIGVGAAEAAALNGWQLSNRASGGQPADTWCQDTVTGADLNASVDTASGAVAIPAPAAGASLPQDITCHLTYAPQADLSKSTLTAEPSENQSNPETSPHGYSTVKLALSGAVRDANGQEQASAPVGTAVGLELEPIAGSGAPAGGARFEVSTDVGQTWQAAGQSTTCAVDAAGGCAEAIRVVGAQPGGYNLRAEIGGAYVANLASGQPTDTSPVRVYFKAGAASQAHSSAVITAAPDQPANYAAPGADQSQWGRQTITVTLRDTTGQPFQDGAEAGALTVSAPAHGGPEGVYYASASGAQGQFQCAAALVGGKCAAGVYTLEVYAAKAGPKALTITHTPAQGAAFTVKEAGTGWDYVTAVFATPPASAADSLIVFNAAGEAVPEDRLADPADQPDGVGVPHATGYTFHPAIRVWDAGRSNPVQGARVRFRVEADCPAVFPANGLKTYQVETSAEGYASAELRSQAAGACQVHGELLQAGQWVDLPGGNGQPWTKLAAWQDSVIDLSASSFTVSTGDVVADGKDFGLVSVTLVGLNGLPVTTAEGLLAAYGPQGEGLAVTAFEHTGDGLYQAKFTGLQAGAKRLTAQAGGQTLALAQGGNRLARLVAGPASAERSYLVQSDQTPPADGASAVPVRARVFDAQGNPADSGAVTFAIPAGLSANGQAGPGGIEVAVAGGWARLDVASTTAATHLVTAAIGASQVKTVKNPAETTQLADDGVLRVSFAPGAASPQASALTIPTAGPAGATTLLVGGAAKHRAEVQVADAAGNPIADGAAQVVFSYRYTDQAGQVQQGSTEPLASDWRGVAAWEFGSTAAASWTITARIAGTAQDVSGSPKTAAFHAGGFDEAATLASFAVDQAVIKADGIANAEAKMKAQDAYGNPLGGIGLGFQLDYAAAEGPLFGHAASGGRGAQATSGADGWARAHLYSLWPGDFDVRGRYQTALTAPLQAHFSNTPASAATSRFAVAAKAANTAYPDAVADGQEAHTVTVTLRDPDGALLNAAGATVRFAPIAIPGAVARDIPVVSGTAGTGLARVELTSLKAGAWAVSVQVGQDSVGTAADAATKQVEVLFVAGPAQAGHSKLVSAQGSAKADGQERQVVTAEVYDAAGNPVAGQPVAFQVPAGLKALAQDGSWVAGGPAVSLVLDTSAAPGQEGVASLALTSTKTGLYTVTGEVAGQAVKAGSPAQAVFANADLSAAGSEFAIATMPASKAVATEFHTARVTLRDVSGNLYTPATPVSFYYRLQGATLWLAGPTVTSVGGVAEWDSFTTTKAGAYEVRANLPQGQIPDAAAVRLALFHAGPADPANSAFAASSGQVAPNGVDSHSATVWVRDSYGNPVAGQPVAFALAAADPAYFATDGCQPQACSVVSSAAGEAKVGIVSGQAATAHLTGAVEGVLVGEADLLFQAGAPSAAQSSWSISPGTPQVADGVAAFTAQVQVSDAQGLAVAGAAVGFDVPGAVAVAPVGSPVTDSQGLVTVKFTSLTAGPFTVNAMLGATPVGPADQVINFVAGPVSAAAERTYLTAPASSAVADGSDEQVVTATVQDAGGNPVAGAEVRFAVPDGATALSPAQVAADAAGQAALRLVSTAAGHYQVTAEVRGEAAAPWQAVAGGSPAKVVFEAGPVSLAKSWISKTEPGPKTADGLAAYTVRVELKDQYSNPVEVAGTPVQIAFRLVDSQGGLVAGVPAVVKSLATGPDGVAAVQFATTRAGVWQAVGAIGAGQIAGGSPLACDFRAGPASAAHSEFYVTSANVLADGQAKHRATVVARDAAGNPVAGAEVAFDIDRGAPGVVGPTLDPADGAVATGADGSAAVDITSKEPGSFPVAASLGGEVVAGAPKPVSFDAGAPDAARSFYTLYPDTAASATVEVAASGEAADAYVLTVAVRSAGGILVPNARLRLTGLDTSKVAIAEAGGVDGLTGAPTSDSYGRHTWHLYSATAGVFTGTVRVDVGAGNWVAINPAPFTLRFGAGVAAASESWLIAPVGPARADGVDQAQVRARIRDLNGNNAKAGQVVFAIPAGVTARVGGQDIAGGAGVTATAQVVAGYAAIGLKSSLAGRYAVAATVDGAALKLVKDAEENTSLAANGQVEVVFEPGPATAGNSVLSLPTALDGATQVADGQSKHRAEVAVADAAGNPVPGAAVMFRYGPDAARTTERTVQAGADGVAAVEFASTKATVYEVRAFVAGGEVADSPQSAQFAAGPLDLDATLASFEVQDSAALATGAHQLWARMRAQDAQGNPIEGVALGFELTAAGPGPVFTPLASGATQTGGVCGPDGYLTVHLVSEFEGVFPVVGVSGADQTAPLMVSFANDSAAPGRSWFTVAPAAGNAGPVAVADGRESYQVVVNLRNKDGDPVNGVNAVVKVTDAETGQVTARSLTTGRLDGQSGTARFAATSAKAGAFAIAVELGGDPVSLDSAGGAAKVAHVRFAPGAASYLTSYLVGPQTGPAKADGNEQQVVQAVVKDANSNAVTSGDVVFAVPAGTTAVDSDGAELVTGPAALPLALDATGSASLVLVSRLKGVYQVTAAAGGTALTQGSPAKLVFANADVSPANSVFTIPSAGAAKTVRREFHTPKVELFDASGNAYTDASEPVVFRWRLQGASLWAGSFTAQSAAGVALWPAFTVALAGTYEVQAWLPGGQVGGTLTVRFAADAAVPDAAQFTSSAGAVVLNDGLAAHFAQVLVLDAVTGGNPVAGQPVTFAVDGEAVIAGAPAGGQLLVQDSSQLGLSRIEIVDAKVGGETVTVTATVGGLVVGSARLDFAPGAPDAARSSWSVQPTTALSAAHPAVLADGADSWLALATVRDAVGQLVVGAEVAFEASAQLRVVDQGPYLTDGRGQVAVTLVSAKAGSHSVRALLGSAGIAPDPAVVEFAAGPVDGAVSYLESPAATAVADGVDSLAVRAYALDALGNQVAGARVRFAWPAGLEVAGGTGAPAGAGTASYEVVVDGSGLAEAVVTSTRATAYEVTASVLAPGGTAWTPITKGSPARAVFVAGPIDTVRSLISRTPAGPLTVGAAPAGYQVKVQLLDAQGNAVRQAGVAVQYRFFLAAPQAAVGPEVYCRQAPDANTQFASALTNAEGVAWVPFLSHQAGPWHGCAFYAGDQIVGGSPAPLVFAAGALDPATTTLEVSQNLVLADAEGAHYAKVWARDSLGNPLGGISATVSIETGAAGVPGPSVKGRSQASATITTCDPAQAQTAPAWCVDDSAFQTGLAVVEFTSAEPGTFLVSATADGLPVANSPLPVSFTSGPADLAKSFWAITPNTADPATGASQSVPATGLAGDSYQLTVNAQSVSGLPVPGAKVRIAGLAQAVTLEPAAEAATGEAGSARFGAHTWALTSASAGEYEGRVQLWDGSAWADLGQPFTVRFKAAEELGGAPSAAASELTSPAGPARADDPAGLTVSATVRDAAGRPAVCWSAGQQVACQVSFHVPAGLSAGQGEAAVAGPAWVVAQVSPASGVAAVTLRGPLGAYAVTARIDGQDVLMADGVDWAPDAAEAVVVFTDSEAPGAPLVEASDGSAVSGAVAEADLADAAAGGLVVVVVGPDGEVLASCPVALDGAFACPLEPGLPHGSKADVALVDQAGNRSEPVGLVADSEAPGALEPEPTEGATLVGRGESAGDAITVADAGGNTICATTVAADLTWACALEPAALEGDKLTIAEQDAAGNAVVKQWRVGLPRLDVAQAAICGGQVQGAAGANFQPGEQVALQAAGAPAATSAAADADGAVRFEWTVPAEAATGRQAVRLVGAVSGEVGGEFQVECGAGAPPAAGYPAPADPVLPFTGAQGVLALAGSALGVILAGLVLLLGAARRRRQAES
jgi:hypothetical protein